MSTFDAKKPFKKKDYRPWNVFGENIDQETRHKLDTNRIQTVHKTRHKPSINKTQTRHKLDTKIINLEKTEHKLYTQPDTKPDTKETQTEHKLDTNQSFSSLVGLQREILIFLYSDCKKERAKHTSQLTLIYISETLKIRLGSIKTTLQRLVEKGFIIRIQSKDGRGGWSQYELPDFIYKELFQLETEHKLYTNRTQTEHKPDTQLNTQLNTTLSSSSSNNKNTTTTEAHENLPDEWNDLDFSEIYGFSKQKLHSLYSFIKQFGFTFFDIQQAIDAMIYDDRHGHKKIDNRCALLISGIRKGHLYTSDFYAKHILENAKIVKKKHQEILRVKIESWINEVGEEFLEQLLPLHLIPDFRVRGEVAMEEVKKIYLKQNVS